MTGGVLTETRGALGLLTLNRPQALNALNEEMCGALHRALDAFARNGEVKAVAIAGGGERAFCAGGDVVTVWHAGRSGTDGWERFFATEYRMNAAIAAFPKPYVALIDGVTMGGGVGVSIHGRYRIATERTLWAMPETGIGMVPDVGSTAVLGRMGPLGRFLALTGARLDGAEALAAGVATHYAPSHRLGALLDALARGEAVDDAIGRVADEPGPARLDANRGAIDRLFAGASVETILGVLDADGGSWAAKEAATIRRMSPTACKLALELLRRGAQASVMQALVNEYRVVSALKRGHDFYEGVRAQLIDKDRSPRWVPARLEEVGTAEVDGYFAAPEGGDLVF
jgi:enoyl-CoA hydratase